MLFKRFTLNIPCNGDYYAQFAVKSPVRSTINEVIKPTTGVGVTLVSVRKKSYLFLFQAGIK